MNAAALNNVFADISYFRNNKRIDDISKAADAAPSMATADKAGTVKMAANVAEADGEAPTAAEFKALLDALIAAGIMAAPSNSSQG